MSPGSRTTGSPAIAQRALGARCRPRSPAAARPPGAGRRALQLQPGRPRRRAGALPLPDLAATRAYLADGLAETLTLLADTPETDDDAVLLPPRAVPRGHAQRSGDLHGAGAGHSAAGCAAGRRRPPCRHAPRCAIPGQLDAGLRRTGASPSTTNSPPTTSRSPPSRSTARSSAGNATCPSSRRRAPHRRATCAGRAAPGRAAASASGRTWCSTEPATHLTLVRGRRLVPLGRPPPADRGGVGMRGADPAAISTGARSGNGRPAASCPIRASSPIPTATIRRRGSATRYVLRGASRATSPRMAHPRYRNYFTPERNDIHSGFRSCAL